MNFNTFAIMLSTVFILYFIQYIVDKKIEELKQHYLKTMHDVGNIILNNIANQAQNVINEVKK